MRKPGLILVAYVLWLLLSWPVDREQLLLGLPIALLVWVLTMEFYSSEGKGKYSIGRAAWFLYYVVVFLWECLKANLDVAYRVLHPALPIRPGTVKVKTTLKSEVGLTFLANSLTLTPGNTTVDIDRGSGSIYIHRLYLDEADQKAGRPPKAVAHFETILKRIFE